MSNEFSRMDYLFNHHLVRFFVRDEIEENGCLTLEKLREGTGLLTLSGKGSCEGFLFPSTKELEAVGEAVQVAEGVSVQLVRQVCVFPPPSLQRRRWWLCMYDEAAAWESVKEQVNDRLREEGRLIWKKEDTPWVVRHGVIHSLGEGKAVRIACARRQEMLADDHEARPGAGSAP